MKFRARLAPAAILLAGAALSAGQAPPAPTPQQPTFKAQVEYVEVDALVTDRQGNFVRDLKKEDFQVLEDGRAQTIATFSLVDIPIERDRKSTRLNSSHTVISYAVFCLKKKKTKKQTKHS